MRALTSIRTDADADGAGRLLRVLASLSASRDLDSTLARLESALTAFARTSPKVGPAPWNRSLGRYPRVLLNDPNDAFQAIVCFWPPGARSAIHDHADTLGGVVALFGEIAETKYAVRELPHGKVDLVPEETTLLGEGRFTPILPEDGWQLHDMRNEGLAWGATLHVYLRPIVEFGVYVRQSEDDTFVRERRTLWFDYHHGARTWDAQTSSSAPRACSEHEARGTCLCGKIEVTASAGPVLRVRCHCRDCQRAQGAASTPWVFFSKSSVRITRGIARRFHYDNDSGYGITRSLCRACGTHVLFESEGSPQLCGVPAGILEEPTLYQADVELYTGSAHESPAGDLGLLEAG